MIQAAYWFGRPTGISKALSFDLRERVVAAIAGGASCRTAAARFGVSASSAIRWWTLELEPILGALVELAGHLGQPAPTPAGVHGLTRLLGVKLGLGRPG